MKIGIITYYNVHNHGAVLQGNGLKKILQSLGHDVYFLTFNRNYSYISSEQSKKYDIGLASIPFYLKYIMQKGLGNIWFNIIKRSRLNQFRKDNFDLSISYNVFTGDIAVIGSDEVFSLEIGYNPCMYGYGLKTKQIISYAGSFGPTIMSDIREKGKLGDIKNGLDAFAAISVRDQNSQKILKDICHQEVPLVCDPVILYGYMEEIKQFVPPIKGYLVVYAYDNKMNDKKEVEQIIYFAREHHLKIYSVGFYHSWCDKNIAASPIELLGWIRNANLVVTDTFHGSVISIICNTPMVVKLRNNSNKLKYLLHEYKLESRIMNNFSELETITSQQLDFEDCNRLLAEKRQASLQFLTQAIGGR